MAAANAGWVSPLALSAIPTGHVIQGPSSRSTIVGPDGSSISSVAPGGSIIADNNGAIVSQGAPATVISSPARLALAAPAITSYVAAAPWAQQAVVATPWAQQTVVATPWAQRAVALPAIGRIAAENTVVAGPSGTIAQSKAINAAPLVNVW